MSKAATNLRAELGNPAANGLVGHRDSAFGQQFLNVAEVEGEASVQPHGLLDDHGREVEGTLADRRDLPTLPAARFRSSPDS